jgi:Ca2+:H+ antiporter
LNLVFENPLGLIAIAAVSLRVSAITADGETTWFEGVLLVAAYIVVATAFFLVQT